MFKVEIRKDCKICGGAITQKRFRSYCSDKCRNKFHNDKWYPTRNEQAKAKRGAFSDRKKKCLMCNKWYVQVGSHIVQVHRITAREYREEFDLPVKKGITPEWYQEKKASKVDEHQKENLKDGAKYRFKKGDPRAKLKKREIGWKSTPHARRDVTGE